MCSDKWTAVISTLHNCTHMATHVHVLYYGMPKTFSIVTGHMSTSFITPIPLYNALQPHVMSLQQILWPLVTSCRTHTHTHAHRHTHTHTHTHPALSLSQATSVMAVIKWRQLLGRSSSGSRTRSWCHGNQLPVNGSMSRAAFSSELLNRTLFQCVNSTMYFD